MTRSSPSPPDPPDAFAALYADCAPRVYAYARRQAGADMAEQVLSDTFLAAWRHREALPQPALPWLLLTARRALLTHQRSARRRDRLAGRVAFQTDWMAAPSAEVQAVTRLRMMTALADMSEHDREALLLVGWDGLDHAQAATVLQISTNAFAARVSRARRRLERALHGDDPTSSPTRQSPDSSTSSLPDPSARRSFA